MINLRLYGDSSTVVIASSIEEAIATAVELVGGEGDAEEWYELDADALFTVHDDGDGRDVTMTGWDWIIRSGRGLLCSTEF